MRIPPPRSPDDRPIDRQQEKSMARILIDADTVAVHMDGIERAGTFHTHVEVPRDRITAAEVVDEPFLTIRGLRAPGIGWPRRIAIGRWRQRGGGKDLVVVRRGERAVRIDLDGAEGYRRLLIGHPDPEQVVADLA
jgi:hypothetical protein